LPAPTAALTPAVAQNAAPKAEPFIPERWDLVVTPKAANAKAYPDWMEVGGRDAGKDDAKDGSTAVRIQYFSGVLEMGRSIWSHNLRIRLSPLMGSSEVAAAKGTDTRLPNE